MTSEARLSGVRKGSLSFEPYFNYSSIGSETAKDYLPRMVDPVLAIRNWLLTGESEANSMTFAFHSHFTILLKFSARMTGCIPSPLHL